MRAEQQGACSWQMKKSQGQISQVVASPLLP